jgi:hypothetical protein
VEKPEGKSSLRRLRLLEIGWEGVDWIHLAQHRDHWLAIVNKGRNFTDSTNGGKFLV